MISNDENFALSWQAAHAELMRQLSYAWPAETQRTIQQAATDPPRSLNPLVGLAPDEVLNTLNELSQHSGNQPKLMAEQSAMLARDLSAILSGLSERAPSPKDKRFKHDQWQENPVFRTQMQLYLAWTDSCHGFIERTPADDDSRDRMRFVVDLITAAVAPSNSLMSNPAALEQAAQSGGLSIVAGFWNMVRDLIDNQGMPALVDKAAFKVGENLGITPGRVVLKTAMIELIQYQATTPEVHARPQLLIPPVVNKPYLMDMAPGRSLIEYLLAQGFSVFALSWRNPGPEHRHWGLNEYVAALIEACQAVCDIAESRDLNAHGICGGARIMSAMLGYLAATGNAIIHAASLIVVNLITDESSPGLFASPEAIAAARKKSAAAGVLDGNDIVRAFTWARPGDLVWNNWVNNYLLGNPPPAYDVLYWTGDVTRLPARLHADLLDIYTGNHFNQAGRIRVLGQPIDLAQVTCEKYVVAGNSDHISPWDRAYQSAQLFGGDFKFVLNVGGHIQTIINPPGNPKNRYYTQAGRSSGDITPEAWLDKADSLQTTWWEDWSRWIAARSGPLQPAPATLGNKSYPPGVPAPGEYVLET